MWLTQAEAKAFKDNCMVALLSYEALAREAKELGLPRWQLRPKHHAIDEVAREATVTLRNPRSIWSLKHEDFMGIVSRLGKHCHPASISREVLWRWRLRLVLNKFG